ncbi:MAG: methyltransferase domain-containing protein [Geobacteraceae bacterium]|nr:methyltransferase domain-containing protein [Geobacteraceae bacterium]
MAKTSAFDKQAAEYDAWFDRHCFFFRAELAALRSIVPATGHGVEIGVGTARFALPLGISIGVEPSPAMAELARQRGLDVREGVAEALPFGDESFDFALMVTVVCFLDDVDGAFREAWRILKPGGAFVVGFIDRESELGRIYEQKREQSDFYRDATFYSVNDLVMLLHEAGFSDFSYRQTLFPGEPTEVTVREGFGDGSFVVIKGHKK